jgi:type IV pilus assembly protein PilE
MSKPFEGRSGFTLIELVITIVIVAILAAVAVSVYRGYMRRAIASEGRMLIAAVSKAQDAYIAEKGVYCGVAATLFDQPVTNKYFRTFTCTNVSGNMRNNNARVTITATGANGTDARGMTITTTKRCNQALDITQTGV